LTRRLRHAEIGVKAYSLPRFAPGFSFVCELEVASAEVAKGRHQI
jgi:hypothetical protein